MKKESKRKVASVMAMAVLMASLAGCSGSGTGESNGDSAAKDGD